MPSPLASGAFAITLEIDEREADQPSGQTTEEDAPRTQRSGPPGRGSPRGSHVGSVMPARVYVPPARLSFGAVRVVAVVPTYNEADNIEIAVRRASHASCRRSRSWSSTTAAPTAPPSVARELGEALGGILVIERGHKSGLGAAYRAGLRAAIEMGADICVQIDADLSHDPDVLPALVANIEHGADLAIGSRYVPGGLTQNWPWRRRWLSRWGNRYAAGVLGLAVNDATAGYRAYRSRRCRGWTSSRCKPRATASRSR